MLSIFINNIERMSRNKWSIEKAPLYKMACKTIMERIEGELCAKQCNSYDREEDIK